MNAPRPDHDPEPDPDEPVTRWEVTGCRVCGRLIYRPARRASRRDGWRHGLPGSGDRP